MTEELLKTLIWRFVRAFVSGGVSSMIVIVSFSGNSWKELNTWLAGLLLAFFVGGITATIQIIDKYIRG